MGNKKSRRSGGMKTTRSQLKKRKRLQHFANTAALAHRRPIEGWDDTLTLKQNYKMLGLALDANRVVANPRKAMENPDDQYVPAKGTGLLSEKLDELKAMPKRAPYQAKSMSIQEQYRLQDLIKKHGDNYEAMQRDLKLNINQDTARQLEKRIKLMKQLHAAGEEEEEEEEIEEDAMVDTSVLADLAKDKKFQDIFADLDSDEEEALLASIQGLDDEFAGDEDEEGEEQEIVQKVVKTAKVVAKKAKKEKQPKVEVGDAGAKLVKPKLSQGKKSKPKVLTREE